MSKIAITKLFHATFGRVIAMIQEVYVGISLRKVADGTYQVQPRPDYISQLSFAERSMISGFYGDIRDKKAAKRFGAKNLEDFSYWAWRSCGIVGAQMVLKSKLGKNFQETTMDLVNQGLGLGGYEISSDTGWYHTSLVKLAEKYGLYGHTEKFVSPSQIAKHVLANRYVLASIFSEHGGHLLLIYGVHIQGGKVTDFILHDPDSFTGNGEATKLNRKIFEKLSTRRIIVFENEKQDE